MNLNSRAGKILIAAKAVTDLNCVTQVSRDGLLNLDRSEGILPVSG